MKETEEIEKDKNSKEKKEKCVVCGYRWNYSSYQYHDYCPKHWGIGVKKREADRCWKILKRFG